MSFMLGRLSINVDECPEAYQTLSNGVSGNPRKIHFRKALCSDTGGKYDPTECGTNPKNIETFDLEEQAFLDLKLSLN